MFLNIVLFLRVRNVPFCSDLKNHLIKHSTSMTPAPAPTPAQKQRQEKIRLDLQKELDNVVKAAIASPHSKRENVPSEITQNLCNSIEAIFIHGLRDPFFLKGTRYAKYPEPNFWPFVSKFSHRSITNQISCLGQVRTEIGKSRAWIRIVLNENALSQYLDLLATEITAIQQFYSDEAFLRLLTNSEHSERIRGLLKPLTSLPISAATNSSFLNTWTPTPLILAGLMTGEPLKVGVLKARPNPKPAHLTEEIAIPAIDALVSEEDQEIGSPAYVERQRKRTSSRPIKRPDNDDHSECSSVYSHPSMLDSGEMSYQHAVVGSLKKNPSSSGGMRRVSSNQRIQLPQSPLFSSTPVDTTILDQVKITKRSSDFVQVVSDVASNAPLGSKPLIISRRIRRPSKQKSNSRSSSEASREEYQRTKAISTRESRANSDLPSTIFGTVPNDVAFSPEVCEGEIKSKPISVTIDSGIAEMASSSAGGTRKTSEIEPDTLEERTGIEERSLSFIEALHELASTVEEEVPAPRSISLTDDVISQKQEEEETPIELENSVIEDDREVFDVSMDEEEGTSVVAAQPSDPVVTRSKPVTIQGGSRRQLIHRTQQKAGRVTFSRYLI
ncbi:hypothetical protein CRE_11842 [Caenorhabditis remanei]|uniref:RUN domain-containing protein n=1 Tax=Caenorhabditis remanei TaxID=31234 RepID=E3M415_CAERE|nr:hypothetical protein CRE_11842 [Caenorhabditis remanei]